MATSRALGQRAEATAARYLKRNGLEIDARNVRYRSGEIDIVATDGDCIVFVEVRARSHTAFGSPIATVDERKQRRIARAASAYLAERPRLAQRPCRFDVVGLTPDGICWIRDAFRLD